MKRSSESRMTRKRIQKRIQKRYRKKTLRRMKTKHRRTAGTTRQFKMRGGGLSDMCGICPICESANTERYATAPAGDKVFCRCSEGHIYSLSNDQSGNI